MAGGFTVGMLMGRIVTTGADVTAEGRVQGGIAIVIRAGGNIFEFRCGQGSDRVSGCA